MSSSDSSLVVDAVAATLHDGTAVDHFIAARTPAWLKSASAHAIEKLHASLTAHQAQQARVASLLQAIQPIEPFVIAALRGALGTADASQAIWRDIRLRVEHPPFPVTDVSIPSFKLYPRETGLLQRVLLNFSAAQAESNYYYPGAGVVQNGTLLELPPERVAGICRELDLGARYQRHLDSVLLPADAGARRRILHLLAEDKRCTLRAHAYRASLCGEIDDGALHMFEELVAGDATSTYEQLPLRCRNLEILGFALPHALIFEARGLPLPGTLRWYDAGLTRQVFLYIANDPKRPLRQQPSWHHLSVELGNDLKDSAYREFFIRQLRPDDRQGFAVRLMRRMQDLRPELEMVGLPAEDLVFTREAQKQIDRIKADAAALVISTAATDEASHRQRMDTLESAGLSVLGLVASFVPGIGELMLADMACGMLKDVFEGAEEWSQGHREQALDHLLGVARNLAVMAAVGAGTALVRNLPRREFVETLMPVVREDGSERLWHTDLSVYRSPLPLLREAGGDGLLHAQGRHWWRQGGQMFEVRQNGASQRWQVVHPARPQAYAPDLCSNGDGAWWLQGEHPLQWQGVARLVRQLGPRSERLSDPECEQAAAVAGYDEPGLRGLLVERKSVPAALVDTLERFALDAALDRFFEQLAQTSSALALDPVLCGYLRSLASGQVQPASAELALWKARAPALRCELFEHAVFQRRPFLDVNAVFLRREFPGLSARTLQTLIDEATPAQRLVIQREGRMPLALLERARDALREARVTFALEGLCLNNVYHLESVRLTFALLRRMPAWPPGLNLELREGSPLGPVQDRLLPLAQTVETRILVRRAGLFEVFDGQGDDALAPAASFEQAILHSLGPAHSRILGWGAQDGAQLLRQTLRDLALSDRSRVAGLIGVVRRPPLFRALQRDAAGRPGYLLSGRGSFGQSTLTSLVRSLFPGFDDRDVREFLSQLQAVNSDLMGELLGYQRSLHSLELTTSRWQQQAPPAQINARRRVVEELRRCWRRQTSRVFETDGQVMGYRLNLGHVAVGDLPELPDEVDFSHVVDLSMPDAGQSQRVNGFMRRFTGLRWLDLSSSACTDLPQALAGMPQLRELVIDGNQICLSDTGARTLASLSRLEVLYLDRNPLGRSPDLRELTHLRRVSIRRAGLSALPEGLLNLPFLEMADLRGNRMETLPQAFFGASRQMRDAMVLHGNPFLQEVRSRLWEVVEDRQAVGYNETPVDFHGTRRRWLEGAEGEQREERSRCWDNVQGEPGSTAFFNLLGELLNTAEYRLATSELQPRVWRMLFAASENTELRESLFELAGSPVTCVDSVANNFSALEVRFLLYLARSRALPGQQQGVLLRFCRRLFRLDRLERFISQDIAERQAQGRSVDEVEVSLAYRIRLARELDLPGQPAHMEYPEVAGVSAQHLRDAAAAVRAAEAGELLLPFIASRDFWVAWLREQHPLDFALVEDPFWRRLDRLGSEQSSLSEGEYLRRTNQLAAERTAAQHDLAQRLTRAALLNEPGA